MSPWIAVSLIWSIPATLAVVGYIFLQWNKRAEWEDELVVIRSQIGNLNIVANDHAADIRQLELKVKDLVKLPPKPKVF